MDTMLLQRILIALLIIASMFLIYIEIRKTANLRYYTRRFKTYSLSKKKEKNIKYNFNNKKTKNIFDFYMSHTPEALSNLEIELTLEKDSAENPFLFNTIGVVGIPSFALFTGFLSILAPRIDVDNLLISINMMLFIMILFVIIYLVDSLGRAIKLNSISSHLAMVSHVKKIKNDKKQ